MTGTAPPFRAFAGGVTWGVALAVAFLGFGCAAGGSTSPNIRDGGSQDAAAGGRDGAADAATDGFVSGTGGASASGGSGAGTGGRGTGGAGTGGALGSGGAGGGVAPTCTVTLSNDPIPEAAPAAKVRMRATLSGAGTSTPRWDWIVVSPANRPVALTSPTGEPSAVEFFVPEAGDYSVEVDVIIGGTRGCFAKKVVPVQGSCPGCFRFRLRPPQVDGIAVPLQEQGIDVQTMDVIKLVGGARLIVTPIDSRAGFLDAYVKIIGSDPGLAIEGFTGGGRPLDTLWRADLSYQVLVVPSSPRAPQVFPQGTNSYLVDDGTFVLGRATDSQGVAVGDTRVLLREGIRPSTIAFADPSGNFNLQARPGTLSAVIVPPAKSGLPEAHIAPSPALVPDANGRFLKMQWAPFSRSALTVTVNSPAGATVLGAHVRAESVAELPAVGRLNVYASDGDPAPLQTLTASGLVSVDFTTDATGVARFPALPAGDYRLTIAPPSGSTAGTLTTVAFTKTAANQATTIALAAPVTLNGTLAPGAEVAGARVVAHDLGTGFVADDSVAVVSDGGRFSLRVAPNRTYSLVAESPPGGAFARTVLAPPIAVGSEAVQTLLGTMKIARAQAFKLVAKLGNDGVGGIVVQVFCPSSSTSCLDPTLSLAEAVTAADGSFTVRLPVTDP